MPVLRPLTSRLTGTLGWQYPAEQARTLWWYKPQRYTFCPHLSFYSGLFFSLSLLFSDCAWAKLSQCHSHQRAGSTWAALFTYKAAPVPGHTTRHMLCLLLLQQRSTWLHFSSSLSVSNRELTRHQTRSDALTGHCITSIVISNVVCCSHRLSMQH